MGTYIKLFNTHNDYSTAEANVSIVLPNVSLCEGSSHVHYNPNLSGTPLTFEILSSGIVKWGGGSSGSNKVISYSLNNGTWTEIDSANNVQISVNAGDIIEFKGTNLHYQEPSFNGSTCDFNVYGNIMSLLNSETYPTLTSTANNYAFQGLFNGTNIIDASNLYLPAITLSSYCYKQLFYNCKKLKYAPKLYSKSTAGYCYHEMFYGCTSLLVTPILPKISANSNLSTYCYASMFNGCTNLISAPFEISGKMGSYSCASMFNGCSNLTESPIISATIGSSACARMFYHCSKLSKITCLSTSGIGSTNNYQWVDGVAASGTFIKASSATWSSGISGTPSGWTVQNAQN